MHTCTDYTISNFNEWCRNSQIRQRQQVEAPHIYLPTPYLLLQPVSMGICMQGDSSMGICMQGDSSCCQKASLDAFW